MKSTIEDVAKEAGVSITTVSRVLNGNYPVKTETRIRVEETIKKLDYHPNPIAVGLVKKKTNTIGVVIPGITNMFFTEVVEGIGEYIDKMGFDVLLSSDARTPELERTCVNKLAERMVDGIIVVDPSTENIKNGFLEGISNDVPLVCINGYHDGININFVISNEEKGTNDAMKYLIECGHKRIAFVRGKSSYSYDLKENIYREYMDKIKMPYTIINTQDGNSIDVVNNAENRIIELNEIIHPGKETTAFFACNDLMAFGILNGLQRLGINVPEEASVMGFDNIILSKMSNPKLTTVDQRMKSLGSCASEMILNIIDKNSKKVDRKFVDTVLIKRESCKDIL